MGGAHSRKAAETVSVLPPFGGMWKQSLHGHKTCLRHFRLNQLKFIKFIECKRLCQYVQIPQVTYIYKKI